MCGRYGLPDDHPAMAKAFDVRPDLRRDIDWDDLMPRYNIAPTDQVPVVYQKSGDRLVEPMRWGLMPFRTAGMRGRTALDQKGKSINTPINARAETVHSHGSFKRSFERRRCIIPAGGYYEWGPGRGLEGPLLDSPGQRSVDGIRGAIHLVEVAVRRLDIFVHHHHDVAEQLHGAYPR